MVVNLFLLVMTLFQLPIISAFWDDEVINDMKKGLLNLSDICKNWASVFFRTYFPTGRHRRPIRN